MSRHLFQSWQQEASDRDSWRSSVKKASCEFEAERHKATKEKCRRQRGRAASLPSSSQKLCLSKVRYGVCIKNRSLRPPTSVQELTVNLPNNPRLRGMSHHHQRKRLFLPKFTLFSYTCSQSIKTVYHFQCRWGCTSHLLHPHVVDESNLYLLLFMLFFFSISLSFLFSLFFSPGKE